MDINDDIMIKKEYILKTNCEINNEFKNEFGYFKYLYGGKIPLLIIYNSKYSIDLYFNNKNCYYEYDLLHPLLKIININEFSYSKNYIIDSFTNENEDENEYKIKLENSINRIINRRNLRILNENKNKNKINMSEIYKNIIKYKSLIKENERNLNEIFEISEISEKEKYFKIINEKRILNSNERKINMIHIKYNNYII